jgi:hypothetical protein
MRRPGRLFAACVVLAIVGSAAAVSAGTTEQLRPDLVVHRASDLEIQVMPNGRRRLRLTTTTANIGIGVVELLPEQNDCNQDGDLGNDRTAVQRIYLDEDGDGIFDPAVDVQVGTHVAGCFVFHAKHQHWHFEDFARYRLVNPTSGKAVATQSKVGFCIVDNYRWRPGVPGSPANRYYDTCRADQIQGLSPGWADVYPSQLAAQWVDVTGLPAGRYCLVQRVDPANRILEANDANNVDRTPLRLRRSKVARRPGTC